MSATDAMRTIKSAKATGPARLRLAWSDGAEVELDLGAWLQTPAFAALRDPDEFAHVQVGDWGHSLVWPSGVEAGADSLWLETLAATRRQDARAFGMAPKARPLAHRRRRSPRPLAPDGRLLLQRRKTDPEDGAAGVPGVGGGAADEGAGGRLGALLFLFLCLGDVVSGQISSHSLLKL